MAQYIYTMNRVAKVVPPKRHIIRDISLSFFPGAKIGVLGLNGSGKSTLMRIMAGLDTEIDGEARPQPGIKIGYLPQEPELDAGKDDFATEGVVASLLLALMESNVELAKSALVNTMGLEWNSPLDVSETDIPYNPHEIDLGLLVSNTYEFSPDWARLQAGLTAAGQRRRYQ